MWHGVGAGMIYATRRGGGKLMGFVSWDLNNFMSAACQKACELSYRSAIGQQISHPCPEKKTELEIRSIPSKMMAPEQKKILPDHRSNDLPSARSQRSTSNDMPHAKSEFEITSIKTDTWSDKAHFWYLPFPPLLFLPPLSFSSISRDLDPRVKGVGGGDYP